VTSCLASRRSFFDAVEQRVQNAEANLHAVDGHAGGQSDAGPVFLPSRVSKTYVFSTLTQGSSRRSAFNLSRRRVSSFSLGKVALRAANHSSWDAILCVCMSDSAVGWRSVDHGRYPADARGPCEYERRAGHSRNCCGGEQQATRVQPKALGPLTQRIHLPGLSDCNSARKRRSLSYIPHSSTMTSNPP
jgi:hypothetical protein